MKLTKKLEAEILKIYHAYWDAYLNGDLKTFASMLDDNIKVFGTAVSEVFNNKAEAVRFYEATADQMTGKAQFRKRNISLHPVDQTMLIHEQSDLFVLIDNEWTFYGPARVSALLVQTPKGWKLAHQHGSFPDSRAEEGEQIAPEQIKKENLELREAVKRRTIELEQKNRELEIEAGLERVRAVAMGMKDPADMLDICRTISGQLETLGINEIRNVQTAIFYPERGTYMNYEYYTKHRKTCITETTYTNNRIHNAFAMKMLKGDGEFFTTHIKGTKVKEWIAYQKTTNVFIDKYLNTAASLSYYWYSLGQVALGVSTYSPLTDNDLNLFKRFRNVFELAYRRFVDIEQAIAQAREARIETALERVRAVALSMKKPEELPNVCEVLFAELHSLGFNEMRNTMINIHNDEKETFVNYDYSDEIGKSITPLSYDIHPVIEKQIKQIRSARDAFSETVFTGRELDEWKEFRRRSGEKDDPRINDITTLYYYFYSIGTGSIGISTFSSIGEEKLQLLKRFRNVFDFAYRRYMDVAQAEAHAKETQIELSLERVRVRSMAMHSSDELVEAADVVFQQLTALGIESIRTGIATFDKARETIEVWSRAHSHTQSAKKILGVVPKNSHPFFASCFNAWKRKEKFYCQEFVGREVVEYYHIMSSILSYPQSKSYNPKEVFYTFFFPEGSINVVRREKLTDEELKIVERFTVVFGLIYRRFLDLQKAEAQAREAQIEAALERVRSRSMAMHKSEELKGVIKVVYEQFVQLNVHVEHAGFIVDYKEQSDMHIWLADQRKVPSRISIPYFDSPHWNSFNEAKKTAQDFFANLLNFEEKNKFYRDLFAFFPVPDDAKEYYFNCPGLAISTVLLENVGLYIENFSGTPYTDEENAILMRFGKVFQQSYTRFLDLQKAEAQAREAQIEAVLERIRASAMAMHTSDELENVVHILREQMGLLGQPELETTVISLIEENADHLFSWYAFRPHELSSGQIVTGTMSFPWKASALTREMMNAYHSGQKELTIKADRAKALELERVLAQADPRITVHAEENVPVWYHLTFFSGGTLLMVSHQPASEEAQSLQRRAAAVFDLAYRRYRDLKNAEAQAREAQIELSLERIRAKVTAMKESSELLDIVVTMRNEFVALGHEAHYFWHMRWLPDKYEKAMTSGDGSRIGMIMELPRGFHEDQRMLEWEANNEPVGIFTYDVEGAVDYVDKMIKTGRFDLVDHHAPGPDDIRAIGGITFVMARTTHGEIGYSLPGIVANPPVEDLATLVRFAGVFDLAYRRFEDLKIAEAQARQAQLDLILLQQAKKKAEDALSELRATQEQLLQQEKLASLGQLTAGIAHEIKNPLNFVNNFSSVSVELVDEAMEEIKKLSGNGGDAQQLLEDVKKNLNKIIEHGTRADGIVKSMLQHSRGGSGKKEPTDLNALVKEYANLAFHGMRAGKNPINVDIALDLDKSIGKVDIIAEDFSRVIINLCQNAFDAMREKLNAGRKSYLPKLTVRTRREDSKVLVEVEDNGPGILDTIKDKILQPFFTTKKGTQGTGLGLSITHDIVKAHGGEMRIETNQNGGATFVVDLPG